MADIPNGIKRAFKAIVSAVILSGMISMFEVFVVRVWL